MKTHKYANDKFANMLKKYNYNLHTGDIVAGTIMYQESQGLLVDIGDDILGYLPEEEITLEKEYFDQKQIANILINTTREFFLITYNSGLKQSILSIKRLEYIRSWKRIKQYQNENIIFNLNIKYKNKGGIITSLDGIQGFIPQSQIYFIQNKLNSIRKHIKCKLIVANEQKNQLIFSHKSALLHLSKHKFRLGELLYGTIKKIKPFGVFIEIYGMVALLHISEIKSRYIYNIPDIFYVGNIIKIQIIHVNMKQGRLSVSRKYNK